MSKDYQRARQAVVALVALLLSVTACGGATDERVAQGKVLYEANCAACHGVQGEGEANWQQPNADGSMPAPPHDASGHTWHHPDQQLLAIIAEGGMGPNSRMPGFEEQLTREEMEAILAYIKTFWPPEIHQTQADITARQP